MPTRLITIIERCARMAIVSAWLVSAFVVSFAEEPAPKEKPDHWAFQALRTPTLPVVKETARVRSPLDRFVLAKLEAVGLSLSPEADQRTLIRRVACDLTGLPPTPSDLDEFVSDQSPDAYERMVERYLASPSYGERWGKWWLDVAGYADSNGYFNADSDRPLAYRYRDYVIRALNADKPFDQFIREQIAGDEISGFNPQQHERNATPEMIDLLEATHFLRNSPDGSGESDGNPEEVMIDRYFALEGAQQIHLSPLGPPSMILSVPFARTAAGASGFASVPVASVTAPVPPGASSPGAVFDQFARNVASEPSKSSENNTPATGRCSRTQRVNSIRSAAARASASRC